MTGRRRSQYFATAEDRLKRSNSSYEQYTSVFDSFLVVEIHPQRDLEMSTVFSGCW